MGGFFVYSFFFGALLLLFPVFADADVYLDVQQNRGWFSVSLYHKLRLAGGYAELRREGVVFHLSEKKAIVLPYNELSGTRKKFEVTKGFQLVRFHQVLESGGAQNAETALFGALLFAAGGALYAFCRERGGALSVENRVLLHDAPCLKCSLRVCALMNGLVLLIALTKKALEGFLTWIRKRRSTVSSKRLRKNLRASSM